LDRTNDITIPTFTIELLKISYEIVRSLNLIRFRLKTTDDVAKKLGFSVWIEANTLLSDTNPDANSYYENSTLPNKWSVVLTQPFSQKSKNIPC
jgi:hypothetical protein